MTEVVEEEIEEVGGEGVAPTKGSCSSYWQWSVRDQLICSGSSTSYPYLASLVSGSSSAAGSRSTSMQSR